jgi:hypothetical protein
MKLFIYTIISLLIATQSSFALTDQQYNEKISEATTLAKKQLFRCHKAAMNHSTTTNVDICFKLIRLSKQIKASKIKKQYKTTAYLNIGTIYKNQHKLKKAYKYWNKAKKLNSIQAKRNLNILCESDAWVCK